jgi:hypothetical protein
MRRLATALSAAVLVLASACSRSPVQVSGLCAPVTLRLDGAYYTAAGPASASDAGPAYARVARNRECVDLYQTVNGQPSPAPVEWSEGDAEGLAVGSTIFTAAGFTTAERLVAQRSGGEWIVLVPLPGSR